MDELEKRLMRDAQSAKIVVQDRNRLIKDGRYPKEFGLPVTIQFEVTSKCNLHCRHCYNRSGETLSRDKVTGEEWVAFCHKLVNKGGIMQATISGGEPLLLGDKLWEMMDILDEDNTLFSLISNGYFFDYDVIRRLKKYRFYWIQISLDSYKAELHDSFRGVSGSWERAVRAAYSVALSGIPLRIASTVTHQDMEHLEDFIKMAINLGASYFIIGEVIPSGRAFDNEDIFLSREDHNFFLRKMDELKEKYENQLSILVSGLTKTQLDYFSQGTIDGAIIRPNGDIRLDCSCPFVIGNILKDDIETVWKEKSNCWQHPLVQRYINACDPMTGMNSYHQNYNEEDLYL